MQVGSDKKDSSVFVFILGVIIGVVAYYCISDMVDTRLPKFIEVMKNGKQVGYARTDKELMEVISVKDAKNPGLFIAFPIYGDKELFKKA